jgi:hypothetical protein
MTMAYKPAGRSFDGVEFEALRKQVDAKFNAVHDELSAAYYEREPFRRLGVLTKEQFDKLHGLLFHLHEQALDQANEAQPKPKQDVRLQERMARIVPDADGELRTTTRRQQVAARVSALNTQGVVLEVK